MLESAEGGNCVKDEDLMINKNFDKFKLDNEIPKGNDNYNQL